MNKIIWLFCFLFAQSIFAQLPAESSQMRVLHCPAIDQNSSVRNIYVDDSNVKWVASNKGLYQLFTADNATKVPVSIEDWPLLAERGGNYNLNLSREKLYNLLKTNAINKEVDIQIKSVFYNSADKHLWIGTNENGAYELSTKPLAIVNHYTNKTSKLLSNKINTILVDQYARTWIGTDRGTLYGNDKGKWKMYDKDSRIDDITICGKDIWILGEQLLWKVDPRNRWLNDNLSARLTSGPVKDIKYDSEGRLWVASNIITRYDVVKDEVEVFDESKGFKSKDINYIRVDQDDALWVATNDRGVYLIEKESSMTISIKTERSADCKAGKNASLKVNVLGGTPPYKYAWNFDFQGDNPTDLAPGKYKVRVTDSEGKVKEALAEIDGELLKVKGTQTSSASGATFSDGSAYINVIGGTPDYFYSWDNGEKGSRAMKLSPGIHEVVITDRQGCTVTAHVEIAAGDKVPKKDPVVEEEEVVAVVETNNGSTGISKQETKQETMRPKKEKAAKVIPKVKKPTAKPEVIRPMVVKLYSFGDINCNGEKTANLAVKVTGGVEPYAYSWDHAELDGPSPVGLGAGHYRVTVTDEKGTELKDKIEIKEPEQLRVVVNEELPVTKKGERDGAAKAAGKGGDGHYIYKWDNGETKSIAAKLIFGSHKVTVVDGNGCEAEGRVNISEKKVPDLNVKKMSSGTVISLEKLYFAADSTRMSETSKPVLDEVVQFLNSNKEVIIEVGGHTNNIPPPDFCDKLSTARAKSVADYLISKGIASKRVSFKGYGKRKPIASNATKEGKKKNQRVEIKVISM